MKRAFNLKADIYCVGIHGITGQYTEEGILEAGCNIRKLEKLSSTRYRFQANTGTGWYLQESYEMPSMA